MSKRYRNIQTLLNIFNIPIEEKWDEIFGDNVYTVYQYWNALGLIDQKKLSSINSCNGIISYNSNINLFFKGIDCHYNPKIYRNGLVADVGSGFGFITFWLLLNGASKVYSIGDPVRTDFIKKLYSNAVLKGYLPENKIVFKNELIKSGDVTLCEEIVDNSLNLVLLHDTLEHITPRIFSSLALASYNNLKKRGMLISKQQNTDSPLLLKKLYVYWDELENSKYKLQRKKKIVKIIHDISAEELELLSSNTRGLDITDFENAIMSYKNDKTIPVYIPNAPSIDIDENIPDEGDTSMVRVCSVLRDSGFKKIKVYPSFTHSKKFFYFQIFAKLLPQLFFKFHICDDTSVFVIKK